MCAIQGDTVRTLELFIVVTPLVLGLIAYFLPIRILRAIAGGLCVVAAAFLAIVMQDADGEEVFAMLAFVVLLSALVVALRLDPKQKTAGAQQQPPMQPGPAHRPMQQPPAQQEPPQGPGGYQPP